MRFTATPIAGAYLIDIEKHEDARGFFARAWCHKEFEERGLNSELAQCNIAFSTRKGTLRGLHYQLPPHAETKLVRCTAGAIFDIALDLRPDSPTFRSWFGVELSAANRKMLYVPEGCAHGYQSVADQSEVFYQVTASYHPGSERGVRWNDPAFGIRIPLEVSMISDRDRQFPDFIV